MVRQKLISMFPNQSIFPFFIVRKGHNGYFLAGFGATPQSWISSSSASSFLASLSCLTHFRISATGTSSSSGMTSWTFPFAHSARASGMVSWQLCCAAVSALAGREPAFSFRIPFF